MCELTVELAAHQLHAQRAGFAADHRDDADVLADDGRVEQVGLGAVVVHVPDENLQNQDGSACGTVSLVCRHSLQNTSLLS